VHPTRCRLSVAFVYQTIVQVLVHNDSVMCFFSGLSYRLLDPSRRHGHSSCTAISKTGGGQVNVVGSIEPSLVSYSVAPMIFPCPCRDMLLSSWPANSVGQSMLLYSGMAAGHVPCRDILLCSRMSMA